MARLRSEARKRAATRQEDIAHRASVEDLTGCRSGVPILTVEFHATTPAMTHSPPPSEPPTVPPAPLDEINLQGGLFSCETECPKRLPCGNHMCGNNCTQSACGECELSPSVVGTCPCGKTKLTDILEARSQRQSCSDPISTCQQICGKLVSCKKHPCKSPCHIGPCPPCDVSVEQKCQCGASTRRAACYLTRAEMKDDTAPDGDDGGRFLCDRKCGKLRSCGRHRCNDRCCPAANNKLLPQLDNMDMRDPHLCMLPCGKKLRCKDRTCQEPPTSPTPPTLEQVQNRVPVMGMGPPLGSQECPQTPNHGVDMQSYTWERTSPINGKDSGVFVLHLGSTPQTSPMSRDPPNLVLNRKDLKAALRVRISRARRGQNGVIQPYDALQQRHEEGARGGRRRRPAVGRRQSGATLVVSLEHDEGVAVAPAGWQPPEILSTRTSPIQLRPRPGVQNIRVHATIDEKQEMMENEEDRHFQPGASPPAGLVQCPVHTPTDHTSLDDGDFPTKLCVTVQAEIIDLDPGLVGDAGRISGLVISRFYHHITGTPMFHVDFGDSIGTRSVPVKDTAMEVERAFGDTQRTLFLENDYVGDDGAGPSQPALADELEDDPDWHGEWTDFIDHEAGGQESCDDGALSFSEDPLRELGMYEEAEDVSGWSFDKLFADDQWQDQSITLLQNTDNFSGPVPGPTSAVASLPVQYFMQFWPAHTLERIIAETNRYAQQPSQGNPAVTNGRADWIPLDSEELLRWFGILMLMGLKEFPNTRCYWDRRAFYNCPIISEAMTRNRFEAIIRCIHLVNNDILVTNREDATYDKLAKVRWLCESFAALSQSLYNNERVLTVDEIMIPYKGRFCNIRQYMKSKPVKFGVKVWAVANAQSRYVSNIIVYLGADEARSEGDSVGEDAVLTAIAGLEGRGHVIVTDNFFTSPRLFMELLKRGFWATGTCRKTRKGFPTSLAGFPNTELPKRGHLVVKMHRSRSIAAICWMDAKPVFLLSTACDPIGEDSFAGRWVGRERVDFPTSPILLQYQAGMRGVDVVDQQRQEYSTQLHSHKWWHRILMFILDSTLLNAYILYAADRRALGLPVLSRLLWHYSVAEDLIGPLPAAGHIRGPIRHLAAQGLHFSSSHVILRRACVVCGRRTRRLCPGCAGVFQCEGACFRAVHTQPRYHQNMQNGAGQPANVHA